MIPIVLISLKIESVRSGAHRKIKSITWSIKRKAASPLEVMSEKRLLMLIYVLFLFHLRLVIVSFFNVLYFRAYLLIYVLFNKATQASHHSS